MNKLLYFSLVIFTAYLLLIYALFKWIPSISQSYYEFKQKYGKWSTWIFSITLFLFATPVMIAGLSMSNGSNYQFLLFLAPLGICFTGAAPQFKESLTINIHYAGAVVGILSGMLALVLILKLYLVVGIWLIVCLALILLKVSNKTYWIEVVSFYTIILSLMFN